MSVDYYTYAAFGVHVPRDQWAHEWAWGECERLDEVINGLGERAAETGHLVASNFDQMRLFLVVGDAKEVRAGDFLTLAHTPDAKPGWLMSLSAVANAAGYRGLGPARWLVIPDVS